jgi:hypothetical protein
MDTNLGLSDYRATMNTRIDAALILWNPDVIELVSLFLRRRNVRVCGIEPKDASQVRLLVSLNPSVVVFDLDPPYKRSTTLVQELFTRFPGRSFVFTCADPLLAVTAAPWLSSYPVLQKPYDLNEMIETVRSLVTQATRIDVDDDVDSVPGIHVSPEHLTVS